MSNFSNKQFNGQLYTFEHLKKSSKLIDFNIENQSVIVSVEVTYGCHCFTEEFDPVIHKDEHRYVHRGERRAFNVERYECSKHLPQVIDSLLTGTVYRSDKSYTYVAHISINTSFGRQPYSIFFSLDNIRNSHELKLDMYIKSAYLSPLKSGKNAENWRFKRLVGEAAGLF